jgi:hypothetical protein
MLLCSVFLTQETNQKRLATTEVGAENGTLRKQEVFLRLDLNSYYNFI